MSRYGRMNRHNQSTDSEGLSLGTSPPPSPRHPVYFVQSPSRDSFYGETPTPGRSQELGRPRDAGRSREFRSGELNRSQDFSPVDSPLHRSFVRASPAYSESESRNFAPQADSQSFNGQSYDVNGLPNSSQKPGSRRVLPQPGYSSSVSKKGYLQWNPAVTSIEEEELEPPRKPLKRVYVYALWVLLVLLLFILAVFILWLITRPKAPQVTVKSMSIQQFNLGPGTDPSGVPSTLLTMNSTVTLTLHNPSRYVKMDYNTLVLQFFFLQLDVADGQTPGFRQGKRNKVNKEVVVQSFHNSIHGAGASLQALEDSGQDMPFKLVGAIRSSSQVLWKFIRPKFETSVSCDVRINQNQGTKDGVFFVTSLQCA